MKKFVVAGMVLIAGTSARAEDIGISCTVSPGSEITEMSNPSDIIVKNGVPPGAPRNFMISADSLITPWSDCDKASITKDRVSVNCHSDITGAHFEKFVSIDRHLGTYDELDVQTNQYGKTTTNFSGTCQRREGF